MIIREVVSLMVLPVSLLSVCPAIVMTTAGSSSLMDVPMKVPMKVACETVIEVNLSKDSF